MDQKKQSYLTLTACNFGHEVLDGKKPALVDFWAPWCAPCLVMAPVIDELAEEFQSQAQVAKLNVDDHQELAARWGIQSIPTVLIFRNGQPVERVVGTVPKKVLAQKLTTLMQAA